MKTVMILGADGRIGRAVYHYLKKLGGYSIYRVDKQFPSIEHGDKLLYHRRTEDYDYYMDMLKPHLVISCLPYTENFNAATAAMRQDVDYCDLGGKVENTNKIKEWHKNYGGRSRVFTDLGLAPGLINIYTQNILEQFTNKEVGTCYCMVGGIPIEAKDHPLNYHCTWSIQGLLNEYFDWCDIVENNTKNEKPGLSGKMDVKSELLGVKLEAFRTSGASSHSIPYILEHGFENFEYKTLRYPHHANFIQTFEEYPENIRTRIVQGLSDTAPVKDDLVIGIVQLYDTIGKKILQKEFRIDRSEGLTAMQVATAVPLVGVAHMILEDKLPQGYLAYQNVVNQYNTYEDILNGLGVDISHD